MTTKRTIKAVLEDIRQLPGQRELRAALQADAISYQGAHTAPLSRATLRLFGLGLALQKWSRTHKRRHGRRAVLADWFTANADTWHEALCEAGQALAAFEAIYAGAGVHTDRVIAQGWTTLDKLALHCMGGEPLPHSPADEPALRRVHERVMEAVSMALGPLKPGDGAEIADAVDQWFGGGQ